MSEETSALHSLLNAASTIAVTRDARAQETFNLVACVGGILLGLPALVLALYGADRVLPLGPSNYLVFVPLLGAGFIAAVIAAFLPGRERPGKGKRFVAAFVAVLITLMLLVIGGLLVPDDPSSPTLPSPSPTESQSPAPATPEASLSATPAAP